MQLAADTNMQIVQPTTASQIFHVLRRQMVRNLRKPLIIFTPKSLLRAKAAVSATADVTNGHFRTVLHDAGVPAAGVRRVLLCAGKVYYDLAAHREREGITDTAIVRGLVARMAHMPAKIPIHIDHDFHNSFA
jgi:2-oxoglutarate dehydrogenase E1 component